MKTIQLSHNDLRLMIESAVKTVLNESVREVMGSAMSDKEDVIEEIVQYIKDWWKENEDNEDAIGRKDYFKYENERVGTMTFYRFEIPEEITEKLDLAETHTISVQIKNYVFFDNKKDLLKLFGHSERSTEGEASFPPELLKLATPSMKFERSYNSLSVPAVEGELQTNGLYSTLYHELNHTKGNLGINQRVGGGSNMFMASKQFQKREKENKPFQHTVVMNAVSPPTEMHRFMDQLNYGPDYKPFRMLNFLFYAIWEITERNARAEEMYGDLQRLKAKREDFDQIYPQTTVYNNIKQYNEMLEELDEVSEESPIWEHAAYVMGMDSRYGNDVPGIRKAAKRRFMNRSRQLIDILYRKAMKVAALYFQKHS